MNKDYKAYLEAVNDIMEFFDSDEHEQYGESYWTSKSGESITLDVGYFWGGLRAFRAYFKKKIDEENGLKPRFPLNVKSHWCGHQFKIEEDSDAYQEYAPDYVNGQDVDKWEWRARCPICKSGRVPVEEVKSNE